jgi:asparagine synthase (glutamine-hydrolysing)
MCGILGVVGANSFEFIETNIEQLEKRGPDNQNVLKIDSNISFGASRLAMVDPHPRSNQPMQDELRKNVIVFNGEIYNYLEIKKKLSTRGIEFKTKSDTEVLLKALDFFGNNIISSLQGMFAFAFYSKKQNKIVLARDFLGKKPLYYSVSNNYLIFSSQVDLIKKYLGKVSLDYHSLGTYLKIGYLVDPKTMYTEIKSISPGEILEFDVSTLKLNSKVSFVPDLILKPNNLSIENAIKLSFEARVMGHSKIAISLSGGIDSTILALQSIKSDVKCSMYSMWWPGSDKQRYNQDFIAAQAISKTFGWKFIPVEMPKIEGFENLLSDYILAMGEPNSNPTGVSMMELYKQISQDRIRLVITGDGADEVFGGYERYNHIGRFNEFPNINSILLDNILKEKDRFPRLAKLGAVVQASNSEEFWVYWHRLVGDKFLKNLSNIKNLPDIGIADFVSFEKLFAVRSKVGDMMLRDLKIWLTMESNRKLDRVSMWHSIEARSPFQSENVIGLGFQAMIKSDFSKINKSFLKENFPELATLPLNKKKLGFMSPLGYWLRSNPDIIQDSVRYVSSNFNFDKKIMNNLSGSANTANYSQFRILWSLIVLAKWHELCG